MAVDPGATDDGGGAPGGGPAPTASLTPSAWHNDLVTRDRQSGPDTIRCPGRHLYAGDVRKRLRRRHPAGWRPDRNSLTAPHTRLP
ncbi:hypothetical protein SUDANB178_01711 [Streptomyces sp. enrichment culture]